MNKEKKQLLTRFMACTPRSWQTTRDANDFPNWVCDGIECRIDLDCQINSASAIMAVLDECNKMWSNWSQCMHGHALTNDLDSLFANFDNLKARDLGTSVASIVIMFCDLREIYLKWLGYEIGPKSCTLENLPDDVMGLSEDGTIVWKWVRGEGLRFKMECLYPSGPWMPPTNITKDIYRSRVTEFIPEECYR
jgi:hypothetical protein